MGRKKLNLTVAERKERRRLQVAKSKKRHYELNKEKKIQLGKFSGGYVVAGVLTSYTKEYTKDGEDLSFITYNFKSAIPFEDILACEFEAKKVTPYYVIAKSQHRNPSTKNYEYWSLDPKAQTFKSETFIDGKEVIMVLNPFRIDRSGDTAIVRLNITGIIHA